MRFQKFVCRDDYCRRRSTNKKNLIWYCNNSPQKLGRQDVEPRLCPVCDSEMKCAALLRGKPKGGRELSSALADRLRPGRKPRRAVTEHLKRGREERERLIRIARRIGDGHDPDPYGEEQEDPDDYEFSLPPAFNPSMRLTRGPQRRLMRASFPFVTTFTKSAGPAQIRADASRALHSTNQNAVMGRLLLGDGESLSAWDQAGRPRYSDDKFLSSEWCHLIADCLGGVTTADNLVSASYAANTEMMVIEHLLRAKTWLRVRVQALCSVEHVAEKIEYQVLCTRGHAWNRDIDAQNDAFTRDDRDDLRDNLNDWLTSHVHDNTAGQGTGKFT